MSTVTVNAHREQLLQRLHAGRGYEFLTMAAPYLEVVGDDSYVRLMAIREYLRLGLVQPARELAEPWAEPDSGAPASSPPPFLPAYQGGKEGGLQDAAEFEAVCRSLADLAGPPIPWARDAERFARNLDALDARGVDVTEIRRAWNEQQEDFQRFRDRHGVVQVRRRTARAVARPHGGWRWIPRLGNHPALEGSPALPEGLRGTFAGPFLFEGLELGWYVHRLYEATRDTFLGYSCPLFVVEPDPALIALVLHLHDWSDLLGDPRVFWFFGDGWRECLVRVWEENVDLPWPPQAFQLGGCRDGGSSEAVAVVQQAYAARDARVARSLQDLDERYARRDARYWATRFAQALSRQGPPLRILAGISTHTTFLQYSMRDARRALESLGHQCTVLTETSDHTVIGPLTYHEAIRTLDPDLFLSIDHIRPEFGPILPTNLPVLTWDQDQLPHVFTQANLARIGPLDFVAGWCKLKAVLAGCNPKQFLHARIPTCAEQFSGDPLTEAEYGKYACDVSYVSHASQTPRAFHEEERSKCRDVRLRTLLDTLYDITPDRLARSTVMGGGLAGEILDEASRRCGVPVTDDELRDRLTGWYLWRLGDRIFRHEALEWVAAWARRTGRTLRIYGNGWDKHPTLSRFAAGPVDNGRELLCVYRASTINLQLMPAGFAHQRALDGLAAGGFFLSRRTPIDLRGRTLRRLNARMDELGIDGTRGLIEAADPELRSLLHAFGDEWLHRVDRDSDQLYHHLRILAEDIHPDEVFDDFEQILFDSPARFAELADRFHADEARRRTVAAQMRQAVIQHYSYRSAMDRFLRAMADYLSGACR